MPDWLVASLLGLIEGLTEFIPVSSTGHLLIAEHWLPRQSDLFNIVVQSGAAVALIPLFWKRGVALLTGLDQKPNRDFVMKLLLAFFITCAGGLVLKKLDYELPETPLPVALATLIGGFVILAVERWTARRSQTSNVTWMLAVAFGVGQLIAAIFPGASRSGSTIMLAMMLGLCRPAATEFSFMLGVPTLLAAGGLHIVDALEETSGATRWDMVAWGTIAAAVSSFFIVKWLIRFVQSHTFNGFAVYRIILGGALLAWIAWDQ